MKLSEIVRSNDSRNNQEIQRGELPDWLFYSAIDVALRYDWWGFELSSDLLGLPSMFFQEVAKKLDFLSLIDHEGTTHCDSFVTEPYHECDELAKRFADEFRCELILGEPSTWNPPMTTRYRFEWLDYSSRTAAILGDLAKAASYEYSRNDAAKRGA